MKILLILLVLLTSCAPKFTLPDEPKFKEMYVFQFDGMVCFDKEGMGLLQHNIKLQKEYADKMRKILEDLQR